MFFFEKKNPKTFAPVRALPVSPQQPVKRLLLPFGTHLAVIRLAPAGL